MTLWIELYLEQGANAYNGVQWRVKSRTWDWWGSPAARYGFSSRKSHVFESFTIIMCMVHVVQRVFVSKYAVERGPKFDIRHEFIEMERVYARFTPRASSRWRCCFVNYKLSDRRSRTRRKRIFCRSHRSFRRHAWLTGLAGSAGRGHSVNSALKQISSIIQDVLREEVWGATSFTILADKCYHGLINCA